MRTITKTVNVTVDTSVIPALEEIIEVLHDMCVLPRYKVVNAYGTEWETIQDLLESRLYTFYKFENGTTKVDLKDLQTGEIVNEFYTITRSALLECARDGIVPIPYIEMPE